MSVGNFYRDNSMTENNQNVSMASLEAQLSAIVAALNMHVKRSEELALEMEIIQAEIKQSSGMIEA